MCTRALLIYGNTVCCCAHAHMCDHKRSKRISTNSAPQGSLHVCRLHLAIDWIFITVLHTVVCSVSCTGKGSRDHIWNYTGVKVLPSITGLQTNQKPNEKPPPPFEAASCQPAASAAELDLVDRPGGVARGRVCGWGAGTNSRYIAKNRSATQCATQCFLENDR